MDEELKKLYEEYWPEYQTYIRYSEAANNAAFPFLIKCPDSYEMAGKRIMFCGQETQGWYTKGYDNPDVDYHDLRGCYNAFVNGINYEIVNKEQGKNSPYWNFQKRIRNAFPKVAFIRNNIVKIGKRSAPGCDDKVNELTLKYFPVIVKEIEILEPDFIIFFTGPKYDSRIEKALGPFSKEHIDERFECWDRLGFEDSSLPSAIRLNHPGWLVRNHLYNTMVEAVCSYIKHFYAK